MKEEDFSVREENREGSCVFYVKGRVNSLNSNVLQHKLNEAFRAGRRNVIVNMMEVAFISSAGIKVLLMFYKRAKDEGCSFHVESPSENVINVLGMTALDDMLLKR